MLRVMIATEGVSDETTAAKLVSQYLGQPTIVNKKMPARGLSVVLRMTPVFVRAAHFGHYDKLIIHFDLDDTHDPKETNDLTANTRVMKVNKAIEDVLRKLPDGHRQTPLHIVLMSPCQSTEAWLYWGIMAGDGSKCECEDRHELKKKLYGDPPFMDIDKTTLFSTNLIQRMLDLTSSGSWPPTLIRFVESLTSDSIVSGQPF